MSLVQGEINRPIYLHVWKVYKIYTWVHVTTFNTVGNPNKFIFNKSSNRNIKFSGLFRSSPIAKHFQFEIADTCSYDFKTVSPIINIFAISFNFPDIVYERETNLNLVKYTFRSPNILHPRRNALEMNL